MALIHWLTQRRAQRKASVVRLLKQHFGAIGPQDLAITARKFPHRMRVDLQRGLDQIFKNGRTVQLACGVNATSPAITGLDFGALTVDGWMPALAVPVQYDEVDIGEDRPVSCAREGLWLVQENGEPYAVLACPPNIYTQDNTIQLQIAARPTDAGRTLTERFLREIEVAVTRAASYRGKVLSLEHHERYTGVSAGIQVHRLEPVSRDQIILPERTLMILDRNIAQFARLRPGLKALGQTLKKGLLFHGPPGTGKTHTIRYLAGALQGHTTLLITAEQVALLSEYMSLARLLAPSVVVLEDADLVAQAREHAQSPCHEALLNRLLNEMDGLQGDAEVLFILTTNRPDVLEPALAARPGRIDQTIEFPLPDDAGREKLARLYGKGLQLSPELLACLVQRTRGVSPAFIKELMRRSLQNALTRGEQHAHVTEPDLVAAIEEMLFSGGRLNLSLLGGAPAAAAQEPAPPPTPASGPPPP